MRDKEQPNRELKSPLEDELEEPVVETSAEYSDLSASQGSPSSGDSVVAGKFYQTSYKCVQVMQSLLEFTTGEFESVNTVGRYRVEWVRHLISLGLSGAVSYEFGLKNMGVVLKVIDASGLERSQYWLTDYLGFVWSFVPNVLVNGKTIQLPSRDPRMHKAAFGILTAAAYILALFPAAVFLRTMVVEEVSPFLLVFAFFARLIQLANGLLKTFVRYHNHKRFNAGLTNGLRVLHMLGLLVCVAATGFIGYKNGYPAEFEQSTASGKLSQILGEFYRWLGQIPAAWKIGLQGLNALLYSACFADLMFGGFAAMGLDMAALRTGQSVFPVSFVVSGISAAGNVADLFADMGNSTLSNSTLDLATIASVAEEFASTDGINYSEAANVATLILTLFQLLTTALRVCASTMNKDALLAQYKQLEVSDVTPQIAGVCSWAFLLTALLAVGSTPLIAVTAAIAVPYLLATICHQRCKKDEKQTLIGVKDVGSLLAAAKSGRTLIKPVDPMVQQKAGGDASDNKAGYQPPAEAAAGATA